MTPLIAITGGIGSGKSAVCRCLSAWGLKVYDCDSRARRLMDSDPAIHRRLCEEISPDTVKNGIIDRPLLAEIVFSDPSKLARLNAITHRRVTEDLRHWRETNSSSSPVLFMETAILLESRLHDEVDQIWLVDAPEETRLARACLRDSATPDQIMARMRRQRRVCHGDVSVPLHIIDNSGNAPLLPRLTELLADLGIHPSSLPGQWKN